MNAKEKIDLISEKTSIFDIQTKIYGLNAQEQIIIGTFLIEKTQIDLHYIWKKFYPAGKSKI